MKTKEKLFRATFRTPCILFGEALAALGTLGKVGGMDGLQTGQNCLRGGTSAATGSKQKFAKFPSKSRKICKEFFYYISCLLCKKICLFQALF